MRSVARVGGKEIAIEVEHRSRGYAVRIGEAVRSVEARRSGAAILLSIDGRAVEAVVVRQGAPADAPAAAGRVYAVTIGPRTYAVEIGDPRRAGPTDAGPGHAGRVEVRAIMPGRVAALLVREGQLVRSGQGLVVVEAMKMENEIPSPRDGQVTAIAVRPGEPVEAGALLATVE